MPSCLAGLICSAPSLLGVQLLPLPLLLLSLLLLLPLLLLLSR